MYCLTFWSKKIRQFQKLIPGNTGPDGATSNIDNGSDPTCSSRWNLLVVGPKRLKPEMALLDCTPNLPNSRLLTWGIEVRVETWNARHRVAQAGSGWFPPISAISLISNVSMHFDAFRFSKCFFFKLCKLYTLYNAARDRSSRIDRQDYNDY